MITRGQTPMAGKLTLTITTGPRSGQTFTFDEHDTLLFGRMDDCQICLPGDRYISRHHFILELNPPDARIRDLGSLYGTHINGQKYGGRVQGETPEEGAKRQYPEVDLHDGDEIKVGKSTMCVRVEQSMGLPSVIHCQRCNRDVSAEVGTIRQGAYVCNACRRHVEADPGTLLVDLLKQTQRAPQTNMQIPNYQIERKLGEGGMGAVYLVRHKQRGTQAALKVMLSKVAVDEKSRQQFLREIDVTRTLHHPHIVEFLENGAEGGLFYFLMEYCPGGSIDQLMKLRGGRLSLTEAGPIMLQVLDGLAFAHAKGFVHRDLKPQNLLLAGNERGWIAKIADMGLAKSFTQSGYNGMTTTGEAAGSFPFMPREQLVNFKSVRPVSDVWAIGAAFYYMLTGSYPRNQPGQDPLKAVLDGQIIPLRQRIPQFPARVASVLDHSLEVRPVDRYQDAGEMLQALKHVL